MPKPISPPFTPEHRAQAQIAMQKLREARDKIATYEACGLNCDQHRQMADVMEQSLAGYLEHKLGGTSEE